jgi:hypothetical protein
VNPVLGLLTLALGSQNVVTVEGSVREEVRAGTAVSLTGPNDVGFTEVLTPSLGSAWTDQTNRVYFLYDPDLQIPDLGTGNHLEVLHKVRFEYDWKDRSGSPSIVVAQDFQYGMIDLFTLTPSISGATTGSALPPPPTVLQPIPTVTRLPYESSNSVLAVRMTASPRAALDFSAGYALNGGSTPAARLSLPLQQGPFANATLRYQPTKNEILATRVAMTDQLFSDGVRNVLLDAVETATSHMGPHLTGTIGGGIAGLRSQQPHLPSVTTVYPEAQGSVSDQWGLYGHSALEAGFSAIMAPLIDRLGGSAFESLQLLGRLNWTMVEGLSLLALGGYTNPLYGNTLGAQRLELLQGAVGYQPNKYLLLQAGAVFSEQQPLYAGGSSSQWLAFIGFVLHDTQTSNPE